MTHDDPTIPVSSTLPFAVPERIGPYRLLSVVGEGGFGIVYMAEQEKPVRRRVALKIIKLGMDTKQVIARFEAERQALAMMDHPNIAKVLDAGATVTGRPYFVMELVRGEPITQYCDKHNVTVEERLHLFMQTCGAVQHAHQKGIIHRDIKPSNVLIMLHDGKPIPKVIDFGIAKATNQRLTEKTIFTEYRQFIGTPEYMSPEQAEMSGLDIDTRSDVYSLGVLLYELLTGVTPFDSEQLRSAAYSEVQRIIREETPPRPSTCLSTLDKLPSVAVHRHTEPKRLRLMIRGDLDWIVMKALEKDRTRRYETASGFASDIARYLSDEPVLAGPPSTSYKFRKFIKRNQAAVTAGGLLASVLILGALGTTWGLVWALDEKRRADEAATNAMTAAAAEREAKLEAQSAVAAAREAEARATAARLEIQKRADELEIVTAFQQSMLSEIDAEKMGQALYADLKARVRKSMSADGIMPDQLEASVLLFDQVLHRANATDVALTLVDEQMLTRAVDAIETEFANDPVVRAALQQAVADTYAQIGRFPPALPLQEAALQTRRATLGEDHPHTLNSIVGMGALLESVGRFEEAYSHYHEAMERSRRVLGNDDPFTLTTINNLGLLVHRMGRLEEARAYYREALDSRRRILGDLHPDTLSSINNMGSLLSRMGKPEEALACFRDALEGNRRVLGEDHVETLTTLNNLANVLKGMGRLEESLDYHQQSLAGRSRVLGDDHPDTLVSIINLGVVLMSMDRLEEALTRFREALTGCRRVLGEDHPTTLVAMSYMGVVLKAMGRLEEAEPYFRDALDGNRRTFGDHHENTMTAIHNMGRLLRDLGQLEEAESHGAQAVRWARESLPQEDPVTAAFLSSYGKTLFALGHFDEAEAMLLEAYGILEARLGAQHIRTIRIARSLVDLYDARHEAERDANWDGKAAEWRAKLEDNGDP